MNPRQKFFALLIGVLLLVLIVELVRRRKLREEYSVLWLIAGITVLLLGAWENLWFMAARFLGIVEPQSALFLLGLIFVVLINLHFSLKISDLTNKIKMLTQEKVLLTETVEKLLDLKRDDK